MRNGASDASVWAMHGMFGPAAHHHHLRAVGIGIGALRAHRSALVWVLYPF
jgi:hypothetical protein